MNSSALADGKGSARAWRAAVPLLLLLASGCASYGVVQNTPEEHIARAQGYSIARWATQHKGGDINLVLAFSGGGTRAAALSYGVLKQLRDTPVVLKGQRERLLDEVDWITSVSGGSFTAAYYGLHGEGIFKDYEDAFLRRDIDGALIRGVLNPFEWFSRTGRTELAVKDDPVADYAELPTYKLAVKYYEEYVFHDATFADMRHDGPMIIINTSDLGYAVRFSFVQEYFNLLCSDLTTFPVARAVAASSAVPVLFNPVVVRNYDDCGSTRPPWLIALKKRAAGNAVLEQLAAGVETYYDKERRTTCARGALAALRTSSMAASPTTSGCARSSTSSRQRAVRAATSRRCIASRRTGWWSSWSMPRPSRARTWMAATSNPGSSRRSTR